MVVGSENSRCGKASRETRNVLTALLAAFVTVVATVVTALSRALENQSWTAASPVDVRSNSLGLSTHCAVSAPLTPCVRSLYPRADRLSTEGYPATPCTARQGCRLLNK